MEHAWLFRSLGGSVFILKKVVSIFDYVFGKKGKMKKFEQQLQGGSRG